MPLKKTAAKQTTGTHRHVIKAMTNGSTAKSVATGADVKKITRRYLAPLERSEVGVARIRKAVRQVAKAESSKSLKKAAKAF